MAEYMNKEVFLSSMGLIGDETKYGNRDAEHQSRSYSSYMSYEIMDSVEDSIVEEELEPVKHGWWIAKQTALGVKYTVCQNCGYGISIPINGHLSKLDLSDVPRCPNCGARMDLPEQAEEAYRGDQ